MRDRKTPNCAISHAASIASVYAVETTSAILMGNRAFMFPGSVQ